MRQIAIYGKGGIGKSTICANLSAALTQLNLKLLQIGCDPKHDSTRLLLNGEAQPTVLEWLKNKPVSTLSLADVLRVGYRGIHCLEAGGPEPGVGCAGRGIISMAQTLEQIGLKKDDYDIVLYDVLGDVVCGGFAVPMRDGYADAVLIVTSGELMALYAANNICKGLKNFTARGGKLAGVIGNERQIPHEKELIEAFAHSVGTQMLAFLPRDPVFRDAELKGKTVIELFPNSPTAQQFTVLAKEMNANLTPVLPRPLSEREFEDLIYTYAQGVSRPTSVNPRIVSSEISPAAKNGGEMKDRWKQYIGLKEAPTSVEKELYMSKAVENKEPLYSCALAGAFAVSNQVQDAITLMHSPSGCAHTSLSATWLAAMGSLKKGSSAAQSLLAPNLVCTNFTEREAVFGGETQLKNIIHDILDRRHPQAIFIITSCPTAIIGDDPQRVIRHFSLQDRPIVPLDTDGIMKGDYAQGWINAHRNIAEALIDPHVQPEENLVNVVGETNVANNSESNFNEIRQILEALGLTVHSRFLRNTTVGMIRQFKKAPLNVLASSDSPAKTLQKYLEDRFGAVFVEDHFPSGFSATAAWILRFGQRLRKESQAQGLIASVRTLYEERLARLRVHLSGQRAILFSYTSHLDWLTDSLQEAHVKIEHLFLAHSTINRDSALKSQTSFPVTSDYPSEQRERDIRAIRPDVVLSNYILRGSFPGVTFESIPLCPPLGFFAGLTLLEKLSRKIRGKHFQEGWRKDSPEKLVATAENARR